VKRCLTYAARSHGIVQSDAAAAVQKAAQRVGLSDRLESKAGELSRGLRQRLSIGQAIVHEPQVLLLDEPAAGLDPQARRDLSALLIALRDGGMTLVVSSHILAELEDYCSEMIIIENGLIAGGKAIKVRDDERPRYMIEIATARSDLREFLVAHNADVLEADQHHALVVFTRNASARARLMRDLMTAGFDVASFGESNKALEDAYFAQVGRRA
jgi:ABC-2 type transport system ATP-binding protein